MAGTRKKLDEADDFWCINCGKKGIPIIRERGKKRGPGHRKALYCINCKTVINHVETRNEEEAQQFREEFAAGKFAEEAEKSVAYAREHFEGR